VKADDKEFTPVEIRTERRQTGAGARGQTGRAERNRCRRKKAKERPKERDVKKTNKRHPLKRGKNKFRARPTNRPMTSSRHLPHREVGEAEGNTGRNKKGQGVIQKANKNRKQGCQEPTYMKGSNQRRAGSTPKVEGTVDVQGTIKDSS